LYNVVLNSFVIIVSTNCFWEADIVLLTTDRTAMEHLGKRDKTLGAYIAKLGDLSFHVYSTPFEALASSIIAQQITSSAAETLKQRLIEAFGGLAPENFINVPALKLLQHGLPQKKARYIMNIAYIAKEGKLEYDDLNALSNSEIEQKLLTIKGIGPWTVQMLLIFCFCRQDVTSYADFGIRHGVMNLYGLKELSEEKFNELAKRWAPYRTTASLYLWQAAADCELEAARKAKFAEPNS